MTGHPASNGSPRTADPSPPRHPRSPGNPARALRHLRTQVARNGLHLLFTRSRLRLVMILICSAIFWTGLFLLFFEGFQFLARFVKLSTVVVEYLFAMFFLSLLVMLVFSTGLILYASLFASREAGYLLTTPARSDQVFAYAFVQAIGFSSWGFLLLGSPMMVAYGLSIAADWPFYLLSLANLVVFVILPGALGGLGAILVAYFVPRRRKTILIVLSASLAVLAVWMCVRVVRTPGQVLSRDWLDSLLSQMAFCQQPLLPSRWITRGLIETARGSWQTGLFYLGVTAANGAMAYLVASVFARDLYRTAYSRVQGGRASRRRRGAYGLDAVFHRVFFMIRRPIRLLILKDLRTFRRDPAQWAQFFIFFGLLALYFLSIRRLGYHVQDTFFRYLLSFLNLSVTALILSTFTSRFIFPMLSLEGRNLWMLGLFPLKRSEILWGKFIFSAGISLVATEILILISDTMLRVGVWMTLLHLAIVAVLCLGLSGISVGLGARMPNLKEDDPSKIAAGFGGTLNLLFSLVFIFLVVGCLALPMQLYFSDMDVNDLTAMFARRYQFRRAMFVAAGVSSVLGLIATIWPLRLGIRSFERMEL
jgi:ABC-2 type transport system permease protein